MIGIFISVLLFKAEQRAKVQVALRISQRKKLGQATKSAGRMPRRQEPMKDGASTDMPRGVASRYRSVDFRMGQPTIRNGIVSLSEQTRIGKVSEGTETSKYLEEKKSTEIPPVAASERGRA